MNVKRNVKRIVKGFDKLEECVRWHSGPRCEDFDEECFTCLAWREFDNLKTMYLMVSQLTQDHQVLLEDSDGDGIAAVFPSDLANALAQVDPEWWNNYHAETFYGGQRDDVHPDTPRE